LAYTLPFFYEIKNIMITQITSLGADTAAFNLTGNITKEDYDNIVFPAIKKITDSYPSLNMMLVINTDLGNFTAGAWMKDAMVGLNNLTKFKRVALVSDSAVVRGITATADKIVPGEYKTFAAKDLDSAKSWISGTETSGSKITL
jgi:hypothetical protein